MARKHGLGRGLGALIKDGAVEPVSAVPDKGVRQVPADRVHRGPWQPRRTFEADALAELTESVRARGVLQPMLVRATKDGEYELIAGERRLRAARAAGLTEVPVIVMEAADHDAMELALIENLQREDLNVLEEAQGYQTLLESFELTQEDVAARVGKARASVTNALRLLTLPDDVKALLADGRISTGHAKALLGLTIAEEQKLLALRAARQGLSVRDVEKLVRKAGRAPRKPRASRSDIPPEHVTSLSDRLRAHFGTAVRITPCHTFANGKKGGGRIEIEFYSGEDLDRVLVLLGIEEE